MTPDTRKLIAVSILGALALFVAGIAVGRLSGPGKLVERTTHHETETKLATTVINQKVDVAELNKLIAEQFAKLQKNIKVDQTTERRPDGTEVTHTVTTDNSTSESGSRTASETDRRSSTVTDTKATLLEESLKVDERIVAAVEASRPRWQVGAYAAYQPFGATGLNLLPEQRLTVGVILGHRLFGPLWVDLVLTSNLAAGAGAHLAW